MSGGFMVGHLAFVFNWTNVYPWVFSKDGVDKSIFYCWGTDAAVAGFFL